MNLLRRLYILAFVCIGLNIPHINCVSRIDISPQNVNVRRPDTFYEPEESASESEYHFAESTYRVPSPANNFVGQFSGLLNAEDIALLTQSSFSTLGENTNYAPPQQHYSSPGGFVSLPDSATHDEQQGRFPEVDLTSTSIRGQGQPADFSGGLAPIDPSLRQNIPDVSRVPSQPANNLTQLTAPGPTQTNIFSAGNFNQSPPTPLIKIGQSPPDGYRLEKNFQQSFLVTLEPEIKPKPKQFLVSLQPEIIQIKKPFLVPVQPEIIQSKPFLVSLGPEIIQRKKRNVEDNIQVESSSSSQYFNRVPSVDQNNPIQVISNYEVPVQVQPIQYAVPIQTSHQVPVVEKTLEVPVVEKTYAVPIVEKPLAVPVEIVKNYEVPPTYYETVKIIPKIVYEVPPKRKAEKQGSIITKSKILFSPRLLAHRSQPFRVGRVTPPDRTPTTGFSPIEETIFILSSIHRLVNTTNPSPALENKKTVVAVHLQSFSTLRPPGNDSDLIEAQKDFGFGAHNFQFAGAGPLLTVFEFLLKTGDSSGVKGKTGYGYSSYNDIDSGIDPMAGILHMVNATEKIHNYAHKRGEQDAGNRFQSFPRDPVSDAIPFIDTAAITKTISAAIF